MLASILLPVFLLFQILGIDTRVGSLAVGKDADLAMFDGDPFEWTTHCTGTLINGRLVSTVVR